MPRTGAQFDVTRTFAQHKILTPGGLGIDISNRRCGDPVLAMADGTVILRYVQNEPGNAFGDGSLIMRIQHAGGWSTGYAHLNSFSVALGQKVRRGQKIGTIGQTGQGVTGCHLHFDTQKGDVHYDPWLMLDQNNAPPEDDTMTIVTYTPFPDGTRKWTANSTKAYTGYKPSGATKVVNLSAGSNAPASGTANIEQDPQKAPNGSGFVLIAQGALAGYYVLRTDGTVAAGTGNTFSKADVDRARKEGAAAATKAALEFTSTLP